MNSLDKWFNVGKVAAERDENLKKYFYDNRIINSVINNSDSFLILGRKGAGKTALFRYLVENYYQFIREDDILVDLSFEDYNWSIHSLLKDSNKAESLAYKQSWKFVIYIESLKCIYESFNKKGLAIPKKLKTTIDLINKIFKSPIPTLKEVIGTKILRLSKLKLPSLGTDLDKIEGDLGEISFDEVKNSLSLQEHLSNNIQNLIRIFEETLNELKNSFNHKVYVCFDRVDEAWDEVSFEVSKKVIAGLISASDGICGDFNMIIRPIIFLREDIFEVISINDSNKLKEDCGQLLQWNKDSLSKMLLTRIKYYSPLPFNDIKELFEDKEMRQRAKPINFIIKRTMMRPRDLICFFKKIGEALKEEINDPFKEEEIVYDKFSSSHIYTAEASYSKWLKDEILNEWSVQNPEIKDLFSALQNNSSTNFSIEQLQAELNKSNDYSRADIFDFLRFLYDNSIIGFKIGDSKEWKFKCFYPSQGFVDSSEYRVHEGLVRALNLKESRDVE